MGVKLDIALCLPRDEETVGLIRAAVASTLTILGVANECVEDVALALSEACTNVVQHATSEDEYEVRVEVTEQQCAISVKNTGVGFDSSSLAGVMPDTRSARGRGVAIMRAVMDTVDFTSSPESGTIVHLVRRLTTRDNGPLARLRRSTPAVSGTRSSWRPTAG